MWKTLAASALLLATAAPLAPAAQAAPSPNNHLLTIKSVHQSYLTVVTRCSPDPNPSTGKQHLSAYTPDQSLGFEQITCDGTRQRILVPYTSSGNRLDRGDRVQVYATISGDSGEINAWRTVKVKR